MAELIAELEGLVVGFDDPQYRGNVVYAGWMAMMASGRYAEVIEPGRASFAWAGQGAIDGVPPLVCRAALRTRDAEVIREMLAVFAGARKGRVATACLAAMEGRWRPSRVAARTPERSYLEALKLLRELGLAWTAANTGPGCHRRRCIGARGAATCRR